MRLTITDRNPTKVRADVHVALVWKEDLGKGGIKSDDLRRLDREVRGALSTAIKRGRFKGGSGDQFEGAATSEKTWVFLGAGKRSDIDARGWLQMGSRAGCAVLRRRGKSLALAPRADLETPAARCLAAGVHLGAYRYDECRGKGTKPEQRLPALGALTLCAEGDGIREAVGAGDALGEALTLARNLVNAPSNFLTPTAMATRARAWGKECGFAVQVIGKRELEKMGCGGILAVNRGSNEPPCLIVMKHRPKRTAKASLALVGKGVTFDTGGISIKPAANMHHMKGDMGGAAAVIAAMGAIARLDLPIEVTGLVPSTENMPDADAVKPGDVITHLNGKTVEILNTDAEGRLILADALVHACREFKPSHLVDFATLTGACVVALGEQIAGVMSNDDKFRVHLCDAAERAGESLWPLPLNQEFRRQLKSDVADLANVAGSRWGGAETAAAFLQEFVDGPKWCHIDIAGPAFASAPHGAYLAKGGTGFGVLTAVAVAEELARA
jgi:leucyl aminopeptidase